MVDEWSGGIAKSSDGKKKKEKNSGLLDRVQLMKDQLAVAFAMFCSLDGTENWHRISGDGSNAGEVRTISLLWLYY